MIISEDQVKALYARIDTLQQASLVIETVALRRGLEGELVAIITTSGEESHPLPDSYGKWFIISPDANVRDAYLPGRKHRPEGD